MWQSCESKHGHVLGAQCAGSVFGPWAKQKEVHGAIGKVLNNEIATVVAHTACPKW